MYRIVYIHTYGQSSVEQTRDHLQYMLHFMNRQNFKQFICSTDPAEAPTILFPELLLQDTGNRPWTLNHSHDS